MKIIIFLIFIAFTNQQLQAQGMFDKIKKAAESNKSILNTDKSGNSGLGLSNADIVSGLKEALRVATDTITKTLSATGAAAMS